MADSDISIETGRHRQRMLKSIGRLCCVMLSVMAGGLFADDRVKPVTVAPIEDLIIFPAIDAPAIVVSLNDAKVSAQAPGVINAYMVAVGDQAQEGQLLASLNCEEHVIGAESAAADLKAATSKLGFAKTQLESARKMESIKGIAKEQVEERKSDFAIASAEIDRAKAALKNAQRLESHCQIRAPFSGAVVERLASAGDYATTAMPIVRLVDTNNIEVSANVQEQDITKLKEAKDPQFFNRRDHFPVKLRTVLPFMDSRLRSFEVRLSFLDEKPSPGTTGRLQWKQPWSHISSEYLVRRGEQLGLFILTNDAAKFHAIAGARPGRPARVDLPENTQVILDGRHGLEDGDPVTAVEPSAS